MSLEPERESGGLAALVVDALITAGLLPAEHTKRAIEIAAEEISVRKALGDYWCAGCPLRDRHLFPPVGGAPEEGV
jgi:hypothetical protein